MKRMQRTLAGLMMMGAAALSLPIATASADATVDGLPATMFGSDTAIAAYVDLQAMTPEKLQAASEKMGALMPVPGGEVEDEEDLQQYTAFREAFIAAGGQGVLMLAEITAENMEGGGDPVVLVKVGPNADKDGLLEAAAMVPDLAEDVQDLDLAPAAPGWMLASGTGLSAPAQDGTAADMAQLKSALATYGAAPARVGFRLTPFLKGELSNAITGMEADMGNPMAGSFANVAKGLLKSEHIGMGMQIEGNPQMMVGMKFTDAASATQFQTSYDMMLAQVGGFLAMMGNAGEMQMLINALKMQAKGDMLELVIGADTLAMISQMGQQMGVPVP